MDPKFLVEVFNPQKDLAIDLEQVLQVPAQVARLEGLSFDEVHIHYVSKSEIVALHDRFFNDPTPTDCISLPMDEPGEQPYCFLGEIFVCPEVAIEYVQAHKGDAYTELLLYTIHGLLHLMGYDDMNEEDQEKMREAESKHLKWFKEKNMTLTPKH